jgi:hypothetical protein
MHTGGVRAEPLPGLLRAYDLANQSEYERLGHAHDRELVLGIAYGVNRAVGTHHANTKHLARHSSQGWVDLRILSVSV